MWRFSACFWKLPINVRLKRLFMWIRHRVYLGLGANLGDRITSLRGAVGKLAPAVKIDSVSSVWDTAPQIVENQPRFLNAAVTGWTELDPFTLLHSIKRLEQALGRQTGQRYGPRSIDIDILLYDSWRVDSRELTIPHPLLAERAFALAPLAEIAPEAVHPLLGVTFAELLARTPRSDIQRVNLSLI
jgi:2-amino-4-hydroxy-6-hydroxymethyldihydropteridine diphosphokinase